MFIRLKFELLLQHIFIKISGFMKSFESFEYFFFHLNPSSWHVMHVLEEDFSEMSVITGNKTEKITNIWNLSISPSPLLLLVYSVLFQVVPFHCRKYPFAKVLQLSWSFAVFIPCSSLLPYNVIPPLVF